MEPDAPTKARSVPREIGAWVSFSATNQQDLVSDRGELEHKNYGHHQFPGFAEAGALGLYAKLRRQAHQSTPCSIPGRALQSEICPEDLLSL